ncbi:MAG: hypothetical protein JWP89_5046 [Schlesneria sp.]|nr:hypothetical protein [Schlesneria sp.]
MPQYLMTTMIENRPLPVIEPFLRKAGVVKRDTSRCSVSLQRMVVACAAAACLSLGCGAGDGPQLGNVTGTITINGAPVPGLNVTFVPEAKGSPSYGGTDENGMYRLMFNRQRTGAEVGKHNVVIENREPETDDSGNRILSGVVVTVPQKYSQPGTLSTEVRPGQNKLDFALDAADKP